MDRWIHGLLGILVRLCRGTQVVVLKTREVDVLVATMETCLQDAGCFLLAPLVFSSSKTVQFNSHPLLISEEDKWVALLKRGEQGPASGGARDRLPRYADSRRVLDIDRRAEDPRRHDDNWRVEEARRLDDARRAEEARRAEDARRLEESRRVEDQRRLDHAKRFEEPRRCLFNTLSSVQT